MAWPLSTTTVAHRLLLGQEQARASAVPERRQAGKRAGDVVWCGSSCGGRALLVWECLGIGEGCSVGGTVQRRDVCVEARGQVVHEDLRPGRALCVAWRHVAL